MSATLLIDEIDKTDQEFDSAAARAAVGLPDHDPGADRIEARTMPGCCDLQQHARADRGRSPRLRYRLDYPDTEHELEIVRLHAPELSDTVARKLIDLIHQVRACPGESRPDRRVDRLGARALLLGADEIYADVFKETMSIISSTAPTSTSRPSASTAASSLASPREPLRADPRVREALRAEGGHRDLGVNDTFAALDEVP